MKCPKCKSVELEKSGSGSPCFCRECGGMWLFNVENSDLPEMTIEPVDANRACGGHDGKTGICPSGHGIMIRARVDIDEPFYLEKCSLCGGIWFDKGEWRRIAENNLAENLSNMWSRSWQRKQSREKNRESYLEINRKILGDDIFDVIIKLSEELRDHPEKDRAIALLQHEIM